MTIQQYEELIDRLEGLADENPRGYKMRVLGLAAGAYAYIFFVLVVLVVGLVFSALLTTVAFVFGLGLIIFLVSMLWYTLKALWVRMPAPEGRRLQRSEAPEFFDEIDRIRDEMGAPKIHEVIVLPEFNAAIRQVPRLGVFGWHKNYLFVGLPLLSFLTLDEFRAVIAHEFGHLSGKHSSFTSWIYRLRSTWARLLESFDGEEKPSLLFGRFFRKFAPYFNAYTFVLARRQEYEADEASAQLAGADAAGQALLKSSIGGQYLEEEFWPKISRMNDHRAEPPRELYVDMHEHLVDCSRDDEADVWLETALTRNPGLSDTHPSLSQRLEALDVDPHLPEPTEVSAADELLGKTRDALTREFSEQWRRLTEPRWEYFYDEAQRGLERLDELQELEELDEMQEWELLLLRERFEDAAEMLPEYEAFWEDHPDHDGAAFAVGRLRLAGDDESGIDVMKEVLELNERKTLDVCEVVMGYLMQQGRRADAQPWLDKYDVYYEKTRLAQIERSYVESADELHQHHLEPAIVQSLAEQLATFPGVREAYLVEKIVHHFPDSPLYILAIVPEKGRFIGNGDPELVEELAQRVQFPFEMLIYDLADSQNGFIKKGVKRIDGARVI
ncbi:MAG: M48 family metallopeptidase [Myxococcota bacterium]